MAPLKAMRVVILLAVLFAPSAAAAQDQFFDSKGVRIRYVDQGQGEPVILIHGRGASLDAWAEAGVIADLSRDYRVIAIDLRGHGRSDKPRDPESYATLIVDDVIGLMDHLHISKAHFVGHSLGGVVVAMILASSSDRIASATLAAAPLRSTWTAGDDDSPPLRRRGWIIDRTSLLALGVPILAVVGDLDPLIADSQDLKAGRPQTQLIVVQGADHPGIIRRSEFIAAVRRHFREAGSSGQT